MKTILLFMFMQLLTGEVTAQSKNRFSDSRILDEFLRYKPDRHRPIILAHRGGPGPSDTENSIATFQQTASILPDAVLEMDVRMTRDSNFILMHDATLDRESTAQGTVSDWQLADLKKVFLKTLSGKLTDQSITTFADVLTWNQNRCVLALDVKPGTDPMRVMKEVVKEQAEYAVFVICYAVADAQRLRAGYPMLWLAIGVNSPADLERLEAGNLSPQRLIALTPQKLQPASFYDRLHRLGIPCSVGTYGTGQADEHLFPEATTTYREIFRQGGDILTTDRPVPVSAIFN